MCNLSDERFSVVSHLDLTHNSAPHFPLAKLAISSSQRPRPLLPHIKHFKMRNLLFSIATLAQLAVGNVLPVQPPPNFTSPDTFELSAAARHSLFARQATPPPEGDPAWEDPYDKMWNDALCRGERLLHAMTPGELDAAWALGWPYLQSPWDGDLKHELETWGWLDSDENHRNADYFCNFGEEMGGLFRGLNVDGRSAEIGGPNHCFYLEHRNGPTVKKNGDGSLPAEEDQKYDAESKEYRVGYYTTHRDPPR